VRLTLRTLLAYLDDTLEPTQARLIGQKVAESPAAQELIARIKQVTRRRRLTSPPLNGGPGAKLDANTIAEYLDNVLPSDQLAEVEETALDSDLHLAEVAACHQILTLVLGEPAVIPPTARQRMYQLVKGREAIQDRKPLAAVGRGMAETANNHSHDEADEALLLGLPLYHRGSWLRWAGPLAAVCLLVGAAVTIWMAVMPPGKAPVLAGPGPQDNRVAANNPGPAIAAIPAGPAVPEDLPLPKLEADEIEVAGNPPGAGQEHNPGNPPNVTEPKGPKPIQPPSPRVVELGTASWGQPSVLIQRTAEDVPWQRVPLNKRVFSNQPLISLPGYHNELRLDSGVQMVLWGNLPEFSRFPGLESAVVLYANPEFDLDFRMERGRVVLSNRKAKGPARIRMRFQESEVWDLVLLDPNSEVSIDLFGICQPYSKKPGSLEPIVRLYLVALTGQSRLQIRYEEHLLPSPSLFDWDNVEGAARSPQALPGLPDWTKKTLPNTPEAKGMERALDQLSRLLIDKGPKNSKFLDVVLAETLKSVDQASRVLALRCLGAMGDLPALLDALADDQRLDLRLVGISELRHFLGQDLKNDQKLLQVLKEKNYQPGQARTILQLLHGFGEEQWTEPVVRGAVVDYLMHDKLPIRQLAYALLRERVRGGEKIPYDPAGARDQRERGYEDWRKLVGADKIAPVKPGVSD
jgi:hypothetical protein